MTLRVSESCRVVTIHSMLIFSFLQGIGAMEQFDKALANRVKELMGVPFVKKLSYTVPQDGVAVNEHGNGFAQVNIIARDGQDEFTLVTAILKLTFADDTAKLKSIVWHTTGEPFEMPSEDDSASGESLGCQMSFPSVVSLDQSGDAAEAKPPATTVDSGGGEGHQGHGPGMNI